MALKVFYFCGAKSANDLAALPIFYRLEKRSGKAIDNNAKNVCCC